MGLEFLKTYSSKSTIAAYRWSIKDYLEKCGFKGEVEEIAEAYFKQNRNYEEDITKYFTSIKGKPPKTVGLCLSAIRIFLLENGVELPAKFWRKLRGRRKGSRPLMLDKVPNNADLRRILTHTDTKGKALFLVLASSGMRIGETLKLKLSDIELDKDPAKINIRGEYTKTGNPRIAFISSEAKEAIQEWLKVRDKYLEAAVAKSTKYEKAKNDDRLFPFEDNTAYSIWRNAIEKAGFNQKHTYNDTIERYSVHPHVLRKFFRTQAGKQIPADVVEALIGHEGYLTEVYRKYSEEDLVEFYKKCEPTLLIFGNGPEVAKLRNEVEERNKQLQTIIDGLLAKNLELERELKLIQQRLEKAFKFWDKWLKDRLTESEKLEYEKIESEYPLDT
jgi:integrase